MMNKIVDTILQLLYPAYCLVCQVVVIPGSVLCDACGSCVKPVAVRRHRLSRHRTMVVHAVGAYRPPLDMLVRAKQHRNRAAAAVIGQLIAQYLHKNAYQYDIIIPVPLYWSRYLWRGYNQAEVIARQICKYTALRFAQPFKRVRYTFLQRLLNHDQRSRNVAGAFGLVPGQQAETDTLRLLAGQRILLVDDVHTTGATLKALAKVAYKYKPACVHAVVGARVVDGDFKNE